MAPLSGYQEEEAELTALKAGSWEFQNWDRWQRRQPDKLEILAGLERTAAMQVVVVATGEAEVGIRACEMHGLQGRPC